MACKRPCPRDVGTRSSALKMPSQVQLGVPGPGEYPFRMHECTAFVHTLRGPSECHSLLCSLPWSHTPSLSELRNPAMV